MSGFPKTRLWLAANPSGPCDRLPEPPFRLNYEGKGCGGGNLPFASIEDAQQYATEGYATSFRITRGNSAHVVRAGSRKDCRHRWTITQEGI